MLFRSSEIHGSRLIYSSPWLIAVSHVLLRLPVPRHSPYALFRLNSLSNSFSSLLELRLQLIVIGFFFNFAVEKAFYLNRHFRGKIVVSHIIWKDLKF